MRRLALTLTLVFLSAAACDRSSTPWGTSWGTHSGVGDVVALDEGNLQVTIRHDEIPGLMGAMTMAFPVSGAAVLADASVGTRVRFDVVRHGDNLVVTRVVPLGAASGRPGIHDHTPHHGGVVTMVGMLHLETLATPDGSVRVYLTDVWRRPLPLDDVEGTVTVDLADGRRELPLHAEDGALVASGSPPTGAYLRARVQLVRARQPVEANFVLPVAASGSGAAGVPLEGCVPTASSAEAGERRPRCTLRFAGPITTLRGTADGATLLVSAVGGGVTTWAMPAVQFRLGFAPSPAVPVPVDAEPHPEAATAIAVRPDGSEAVVSNENRLGIYALASGRLLRELPSLAGMVRELAWSPDGTRLLVSVFYDSAAHLLQADDGHEVGRFPVEREAAAVAFAADGTRAAIGSETGPIVLVDVAGGKIITTIGNTGRPVQALAFVGDRLVSAGGDGAVVVWDVAKGRAVSRAAVGSALSRLAVAPGGRVIASAGFDPIVRLHDLETGALLETLAWHRAAVWGLAWAGPVLFSGDGEGEVAVWDLGDALGATKETLTGGTGLD